MTRAGEIARLAAGPLDLLVIGGGIVGSGVARDAAMRGLRVGLVEQDDFASGTSSRSSRLLHGGLRYLEQGRIGMVRNSSREKICLARIAPHLAEPRAFLFPSYRPGGRPLWQLTLGVKLYDLLCGGRNLSPSSRLSRTQVETQVPLLNREGLRGAVRYFDAFTNDARLVIDTLRSASIHGAAAANYLRFMHAERKRDQWHCEIRDLISDRRFVVPARVIVNATGPWSEHLGHSGVRLRLSKGIHLVIDRSRLPVPAAVVITEGKRLLFVLPWGERVIVGTTDTDYRGAPGAVAVNQDDIAYLVRALGRFFPAAGISPADIISTWAGVRPLIANPDGSPSDISRKHQLGRPVPGWWDIAGGKLTTYRLMAEQAVNRVIGELGLPPRSCRTAHEPLLPAEATRFSSVVPPPCTEAAVRHYVESEWAMRLEDVMVRRGGWQHYHANAAGIAEKAAGWMGAAAGWSAARQEAELAAFRAATRPGKDPGGPAPQAQG